MQGQSKYNAMTELITKEGGREMQTWINTFLFVFFQTPSIFLVFNLPRACLLAEKGRDSVDAAFGFGRRCPGRARANAAHV
jgi:hypothetical protein